MGKVRKRTNSLDSDPLFSNSSTTNSHETTSMESFLCHICTKRFDTKGRLKSVFAQKFEAKSRSWLASRHLRTHTKPFQCPTCQRGFALRLDLGRHIKSQHRVGNKQYRCSIELCMYTSNRKDNLSRHLRSRHSNDITGSKGKEELETNRMNEPSPRELRNSRLSTGSVPLRPGEEDMAASGMENSSPTEMMSSKLSIGLVPSQLDTHGSVEGLRSYSDYTNALAYHSPRIDTRSSTRLYSETDETEDPDIFDGSNSFTNSSGASVLSTSSSHSARTSRIRPTRKHVVEQAAAMKTSNDHASAPIPSNAPEPRPHPRELLVWHEWIQSIRLAASAFLKDLFGRIHTAVCRYLRADSFSLAVDFVLVTYGLLEPILDQNKIRLRWRCVCFPYSEPALTIGLISDHCIELW
jgi:hypothetical protein